MKVYILRHGKALDGTPDQERELANRGRSDVKKIAKHHREECAELSLILSSPYTRAWQTAALFAEAIRFPHTIQRFDELAPSGSPQETEAFLSERNPESVLLVSHMPLVGDLVDYFTGSHGTHFGTSNLALLEMEIPAAGQATLKWIHHVA